jgi:GNAT superfamily N-acetyltransferase
MALSDDQAVRELFAACHPGWRPCPPFWYFAHPTLVIRDRDRIIGFTSFAVSIAPILDRQAYEDDVIWGRDVCVHPEYQGHGLGLMLCEERLDVARDLGLHFFIGTTWASNRAMIAIFERQGCVKSPTVLHHAYPDNPVGDQVGVMYTKGF